MPQATDKLLLRALKGETLSPPPVWMMRQAGRYLPEYRAVRGQAGGFMDLCLNPELACEVTLQPIRRYGFDGSILFCDILIIPWALGQSVGFTEGIGPQLTRLEDEASLAALSAEGLHDRLEPVYRALELIKAGLPAETTLIGFAGAPWTVASYMLEGGTSRDFARAKTLAYGEPALFQRLIDLLVEVTSAYLIRQAERGAEVLQLFDSWAGIWPEGCLKRWCLEPASEIVRRVKAVHPNLPIILFPRGAGLLYADFARDSGCDALSLDTTVPLAWARDTLQDRVVLQGNLDPIYLVTGGAALDAEVRRIRDSLGKGPFVFNLGHGIVPQTPPENVARALEVLRE